MISRNVFRTSISFVFFFCVFFAAGIENIIQSQQSFRALPDGSRAMLPNTSPAAGNSPFGVVSQGCAPAPVGLISWWTADGNSLDSRLRNNGTLTNGATFGAGQNGQGFSLDGVDDFVQVPHSTSQNVTGSFTVEAWIFPLNDNTGHIISKWGDAGAWVNQRAFNFKKSPNRRLSFGISDNANQNNAGFHAFDTPNDVINLNAWNHVAAVYDQPSGQRRIYVNGSLVSTRAGDPPITITSSIADMAIGTSLHSTIAPTAVEYFTGTIDEPAFYNRALSASELAAIFNAGINGKCKPTATTPPTGLAGWWSGDGNPNDFSGSGNNGTLQNGTTFSIGKVGQGFGFDGVDDSVQAADAPSLNPTTQMSFESWVYPTTDARANDVMMIIANKEIPSPSTIQYEFSRRLSATCGTGGGIPTGNLAFFIGGVSGLPNDCSGWVDGGANLPLNAWSHMTITYDGAAIRAYVNGALSRTISPVTGNIATSNGLFKIGSRTLLSPNVEQWTGRIDEVSIYNRALTAAEVQSIYNAGLAGKLKTATTPTGFAEIAGEYKDISENYSKESFTPNSPQAVNVTVGDATVSFPSVTAAGITQEIPLSLTGLPALPSGTSTGLIYDISTSAVFTGSPTVCFNIPALASVFPNLRIYHLESGAWMNRTATSGNTPTNFCTSALSSLSPFAIVQAVPTAAAVSVGGRVLAPKGAGISKARVTLTGSNGETRSAMTNAFGYYRFENVSVGQTYVFSVSAKRYQFEPQAVTVTEETENLDFTSSP